MAIKGNVREIGLVLSGQPVKIAEANLILTQPTIKQIVAFGEDDFTLAVSLITHTENFLGDIKKGNFELDTIPDFQLLLIMMREDKTVRPLLSRLFEFIFLGYKKIVIGDVSIDFYIDQEGQLLKVGMINPFNYEKVQDCLSDLFMPQNDKEIEYNPANDMAAQIAEKLRSGRKKVQEMQSKKEGNYSVYAKYISVLAVGLQMDINILFEYTPFQLYDTLKRYNLKQASDYYQKLRSTPFIDVSKIEAPDDWTMPLYKRY